MDDSHTSPANEKVDSFITTAPFRAAFKMASRELQKEVEHAVQQLIDNKIEGKAFRWSNRDERGLKLRQHTLLYAREKKNRLVLLDLYETNVFFKNP